MKHYLWLLFMVGSIPSKAQLQFNAFDEVLNYADKHAIAIQGAQINEQISVTEKKERRAYLLPTLDASLGYNDNITLQPTLVPAQVFNPNASEGEFQELTFGTQYQYTRNFQAQWDILNFQKIFALQTANLQIEESSWYTELSRYHTYHQLASTYYSILLTQESIRIYEENVAVAAAIFDHSTDKFEKGYLSEAELNRAEIKKIQTQNSLRQAENNLEQFYLQLQNQLNTDQEISIQDTPEKFVLASTTIQAPHPEVIWQEAVVNKQQAALKQIQAMRLPTLSLIYQNNRTWATDEFFSFSDANELPQQTFGLRLSFSGLFSTGTRQKVTKTKWQLQLQELQLKNTRLVKQREDQLLQLQLEQASDQLAESQRILALQKKNDFHAENTYQGGIISLDKRLDQYDDFLAAQDSYLQSLAAYSLAQYKIYIRQIDFRSDEN